MLNDAEAHLADQWRQTQIKGKWWIQHGTNEETEWDIHTSSKSCMEIIYIITLHLLEVELSTNIVHNS